MIRDCAPGTCDHYGCRLRQKGVQVHAAALPSRHNRKPGKPMKPPSHWGNAVYDKRPDGSMMPVLHADGSPVRQRQVDQQPERMAALKRHQHQNASTDA